MCFSVIFARRRTLYKSLDFVAENEQTRDQFAKGLQYMVDMRTLERLHFDEERWLMNLFRRADTNGNGERSLFMLFKGA